MTFKNSIDCINDSIVEVISHFIKIESHGTTHKALCPFHQEKTPSFSISESKGIFKCFGCGKVGDAISFIEEHEKVEFKEALTIGASILNLQPDWETGQEDFNEEAFKYDESLKIINGKVALFYQQCLRHSPTATEYIRSRNFEVGDKPDDKSEDDPLVLGYAPAGNVLIKWARENQINLALMKELGLIVTNKDTGEEYDFFRDRIIFPVCEKGGKVSGFSGRSLHEKKGTPKYLNSPESKIYHKGKELFALNVARRAIKSENRAYLVEGNFDVKRLHTIGVFNVVATCGTALTTDQVMLLKQYSMNLTLIYDGDDAGHKAIDCNGKLLVKEQFRVMVLQIPDGEDPDSLFTSLEKFEACLDKSQTDFIIYKAKNGLEQCKNPAFKSDFIREIASLIVCYDEQSMRDSYVESAGGIIKPKKALQDQVRSMQVQKTTADKKPAVPTGISADEFIEMGFYEQENCYFFADSKGIPHQRSNFVMSPIFHIESTINAKRLYEVKNNCGQTRVIEIPQKDMVSLTAFQIHIESLGNFYFDGSQADLNRLKRWLYGKTDSCKEIQQLGWQKEGFWAWGNGIFNNEFTPVNSYGNVTHNNRNYYIPAFSSIYKNEQNLFLFERRFIHCEGEISLLGYVNKLVTVFGDNAKIGFCFYLASLFRDIILNYIEGFPILNMFGPKGTGKTACGESLVQFFGRLSKAPNLHNSSKAALGYHVATSSNAMVHIDEYRNDVEMEKREFLKGIWDSVGRMRMNMDKDKKKEMTSVDQSVILTGQHLATADIALFTRTIHLSFTQTEFSDPERDDFVDLKELEKRGLTHLTHQILALRGYFQDNFKQKLKQISETMRESLNNEVVMDRIFNNWLIVLSAYATLRERLELPWDLNELIKMAVAMMIQQNKETKKSDDVGNFWKVVQYLISSNMLFEDGDYKVVYASAITQLTYENGRYAKSVMKFPVQEELLYITTSRVFSLYKSQCLKEGDKPLSESTIENYLRNSPAFICETKKEGFKKIDPRTGFQETSENGERKRTSTTALIFYAKKTGLMLGASINTDSIPVSDTNENTNITAGLSGLNDATGTIIFSGEENDHDLPF